MTDVKNRGPIGHSGVVEHAEQKEPVAPLPQAFPPGAGGGGSLPPIPRPPSSKAGSLAPPPAPAGHSHQPPPVAEASTQVWQAGKAPDASGGALVSLDRIPKSRVAVVLGGAGVVIIVTALAIGFASPPTESTLSPMVQGALILSRALMALGILAIGLGLVRVAGGMLIAGSAKSSKRD